jgi:pre-mRNA-splicing factor CWC22
MVELKKRLGDDALKQHLEGVFPRDSVNNARFSINFFTSIGLGAITEDLREFLKNAPKLLLEKKYAEMLSLLNKSDSSSSESESSDSDSDSSSSSSSSEDEKRKKRRR